MHDNFDVVERLCIRVPKVYDWVQRAVRGTRTFEGVDAISALNFEFSNSLGSSDDNPFDYLEVDGGVDTAILVDPTAFSVAEVPSATGTRPTVTTVLPNGEVILLQRVRVRVEGTYRVELRDSLGTVGISQPVSYSTIKTFFLCAPEGTEVEGTVTSMEDNSESNLADASPTIDLDVTFCLNVYSVMDVNIEVEGSYVGPRPELISDICSLNTMPPTCPTIFPGMDPDC
ncbi:hypothetical protein [Metabacillus iocasae]|uniref:Uncharacterized protein n=1 Tax=Priestia iocasae TaxID=2291674 RepID=A0ABS2QSU2_9BACI|nr:hypothetical protein [Metabacillus iocasae]MBM7702536.1 hypothetical protein [Metabacillus iocasae]